MCITVPPAQLVRTRPFDCCLVGAFVHAVESGFVDVSRWLVDRDTSVRRGRLCLQNHWPVTSTQCGIWWSKQAKEIPSRRETTNVERGHFEMVRYLHEQGWLPMTPSFGTAVSTSDDAKLHAPAIEFLRKMGKANIVVEDYPETLKPYAEVAWKHSTPSEKLLRAIADRNVEALSGADFDLARYNLFVFNDVGESGHLHDLQWFCEYEYPDWPRTYDINNIRRAASRAAAHGHLAILEWLYEAISYRATPAMLGAAAERGRLDVFRWVYQRDGNAAMTSDVMDIAAESGHLPLVKWLHEHSSAGCTKAAMDDAASRGHLHVVEWLHSHRFEGCTTNAMVQAAQHGHLEVVVWLHKHRAEGCAEDSVYPRSVHVLKWFAANRSYKGTSRAMEVAAHRGDLESLKVRLGIGSQVPSVSFAASAAIHGHLGVLEWIYKRYPAQFDVKNVREQGTMHPYVNDLA